MFKNLMYLCCKKQKRFYYWLQINKTGGLQYPDVLKRVFC